MSFLGASLDQVTQFMDGICQDGCEEIALAYCIIEQALRENELCDELLVQLCNQTCRNLNHESRERGWTLLSLALGAFPPSKKLKNYLLKLVELCFDLLVYLWSISYHRNFVCLPPFNYWFFRLLFSCVSIFTATLSSMLLLDWRSFVNGKFSNLPTVFFLVTFLWMCWSGWQPKKEPLLLFRLQITKVRMTDYMWEVN